MKKKLFIIIWNMGLGGIQKRVRDVLIQISEDYPEWEVFLLVKFKKPSYFIDEIQSKTNTHILFYSQSHKKSNSLPSFFWVIRKYLQIKPNIVLTFLDHLSITMVIIKYVFFWIPVKVVLNEGVLTSNYLKINRAFFWEHLIRIFYRFANKIIVPTKAVKQDLWKNFGVSLKKIVIIPNWTLFPHIKKSNKKTIDLIYIGRFEKEKNPMGFLKIVRQLQPVFPSIKCHMLGDGRQKKDIKKFIHQHKLEKNIAIDGVKNPISYLKKSKILILPTLNEGMPNVVLEAAMCLVPTISSNFEGANEVIDNTNTGFICDNIEEMIQKTAFLLKKASVRKKVSQNAQKYVLENHSNQQQTAFIKEVLE